MSMGKLHIGVVTAAIMIGIHSVNHTNTLMERQLAISASVGTSQTSLLK